MSDNIAAPVVAGLVVGVVFVVIFSLVVNQGTGFTIWRSFHGVTVIIPEASSRPDPEHNNFEPQVVKVVIGVNNTVRWINQDTVPHWIEPDDDKDPGFIAATNTSDPVASFIQPNEYFEYTFTKAGEYGYHGKPWMRGTVIVHENTPEMLKEEGQQPNVGAVEVIFVDFSPVLAEQDIVVKKGQTVKVPVMIESDKETEKVLSLSIIAQGDVPDSGELELSLDKESIVLSKDDTVQGKAQDNGFGRLIRDAGFLTVSASPTARTGTYEYGLEASYEGDGGDGMGAGQIFRVTIVE